MSLPVSGMKGVSPSWRLAFLPSRSAAAVRHSALLLSPCVPWAISSAGNGSEGWLLGLHRPLLGAEVFWQAPRSGQACTSHAVGQTREDHGNDRPRSSSQSVQVAVTEYDRPGSLNKTRLVLTVLGAGRDQGTSRLGSGAALLLAYGWALPWWRERSLSLMSLFIRALIPFVGAPPSPSNFFPKVPSPNTSMLGIRTSTCNLGGGHLQSLTLFYKFSPDE